MSIEINKTGYCEGCPFAEIEVYEQEIATIDGDVGTLSDIKCKHEPACGRMNYIMNLQRDYILQEVCSLFPEDTLNEIKDMAKKNTIDAFTPDIILRKQRVVHCKLD